MTEEEKQTKEYRESVKSKFFLSEPQLDLACQGYKDGYLAGLRERKSQLTEKDKQIEELRGQLVITEHDREHNDYELAETYKKIAELEAQIEKMKKYVLCDSCKYYKGTCKNTLTCSDHSQWESKE